MYYTLRNCFQVDTNMTGLTINPTGHALSGDKWNAWSSPLYYYNTLFPAQLEGQATCNSLRKDPGALNNNKKIESLAHGGNLPIVFDTS